MDDDTRRETRAAYQGLVAHVREMPVPDTRRLFSRLDAALGTQRRKGVQAQAEAVMECLLPEFGVTVAEFAVAHVLHKRGYDPPPSDTEGGSGSGTGRTCATSRSRRRKRRLEQKWKAAAAAHSPPVRRRRTRRSLASP